MCFVNPWKSGMMNWWRKARDMSTTLEETTLKPHIQPVTSHLLHDYFVVAAVLRIRGKTLQEFT
jgi:hypothetical protein